MAKFEIDFECYDSPLLSDDVITNSIREAFARSGYQVGDCVIIERNSNEGVACIVIHSDEVDVLNDPREFIWNDVESTVVGLYDGDFI